ncbi:cuticle protein AMP2-like [Oratosquilla oratoria]|uniref:cuticle protein AMP2-like n=1 Tax=Oratosquilla oratoria TaxID=337810 RepID=UPI003F76C290
MKLAIIAALVAVASCAKLPGGDPVFFQVLRDDRVAPESGFYNTDFETENGIRVSESGAAGSAGQSNVQGVVSYPDEFGNIIEYSFTADEFGYRPVGAVLPTPPPAPAHVARLLEIAEEQRRQGITFE